MYFWRLPLSFFLEPDIINILLYNVPTREGIRRFYCDEILNVYRDSSFESKIQSKLMLYHIVTCTLFSDFGISRSNSIFLN